MCLTLCDPVDRSTPGSPVRQYLPECAQTREGDRVTAFHSSTSPCPTVTPLTHRMGAPGSALRTLGLERRPGQACGKRMTLMCSSLQRTPEEAQTVHCTPFGRPCPKQSLIKRKGMPIQTNPKMHSSFTYTGFSLS